MASEQLKLVIDVATAQAVKETKNLAKAVRDVGSEEIDLRSAADQAADALDAASAAMIADLKRAESAAEALGRSLGPDLSAKIGDAKLDSFIADLRRMGLSFEEIEGNSDRFAASLRKIDESTGSIKNVEGAVARLGHESDNSRSVLANMVGNSVQDLGALGGVAGTTGMMIGQLAEYATEGNISLAGLAGVAGPMAVVGLVVAAISQKFEEQKALQEQTRRDLDKLKNAYENVGESGLGAARALASQWLQDGGKITAVINQLIEGTEGLGKLGTGLYSKEVTEDLGDEIRALKLDAEMFAEMALGSADAVWQWAEKSIAAGANIEQVSKIIMGAAYWHEQNAQRTEQDAINQELFGDIAAKSGQQTAEAMSSVDGAALRAAESIDTMNNAIANDVSLQGSYVGVIDSLGTLRKTLGDGQAGWVEQQNAIIGAQNAVIGYVNQLGGVPPEKLTYILALLSQGNVNEVVRVLNDVTQDRTIRLRLAWKQGGINPAEDMPNMPVVTVPVVPEIQTPVNKGGGGAKSGGGKTAAEIEADKAAAAYEKQKRIEDNKYALGVTTDAQYRKILEGRLARESKYSDEYTAIVMKIRGIDDKAAKAKADEEKRKKDAADKAKKAAEDARQAAQRAADEEMQRRANQARASTPRAVARRPRTGADRCGPASSAGEVSSSRVNTGSPSRRRWPSCCG